jgi:hypothetical protein
MHHSEPHIRHEKSFASQHFGSFNAFDVGTQTTSTSYEVIATAKGTFRLFQTCTEKDTTQSHILFFERQV